MIAFAVYIAKSPAPLKSPTAPTPAPRGSATPKGLTKHPSGLKYVVLRNGKGSSPQRGRMVSVHYTGWLFKGYNPDGSPIKGKQFDSSRKRGTPFKFPLGVRRVIRGWDIGVALMKKGGRRLYVIPPALAYGSRGFPGAIPPNSTLIFDVELIDF
ncbi:MAG: FKBP-type peptidyl-prolyl cis-trans isomerase [Deltaproteobacteria bacterium]|nr:MAG: FKBP-type peptidyl-prolyl cis-trans isomerase [Deltaproteobacteria bacterium]